jgi:hypothetical protein
LRKYEKEIEEMQEKNEKAGHKKELKIGRRYKNMKIIKRIRKSEKK